MRGFDEIDRNADETTPVRRSKEGLYSFRPEPKEILSGVLKNNPMAGIMFSRLIFLLYTKRRSVDWWRYKHRIIGLLLISILNSVLSLMEYMYIAYLLAFQETRHIIQLAKIDDQAPVFILGHPRTGTTLLHSLLSLDEERFTTVDTFMAGFPHCFLFFERAGKFLFKGILSPTRPMDNMKLHFDLPQEDELGTNSLSGYLVSPYNSLVFMRDEKEYRKYQCFKEGQVDEKDEEKWVYWFRYYITKVKMRDLFRRRNDSGQRRSPRQLVLKSPCHTGRVRLLLKLFPKAKFIFIHRNPYEVFLSGAHLASTTYGWQFLQQPSDSDLQEYILRQGEILHSEYFSSRGLLGPNQLVEVSFEELTTNPQKCVTRIYSELAFDSFDAICQSRYPERLKRECVELEGYQRNKFKKVVLDDILKETIKERWRQQFQTLGYDEIYPSDRML